MSIPDLLRQNLAEHFGLLIDAHPPGFAGSREQLDLLAGILADAAIYRVDQARPAASSNPDGKSCATCRWWVQGRREHMVHTAEGRSPIQWSENQWNGKPYPQGECRAAPPAANCFPPFPITRPEDWCVCHHPRPSGEVSAEQIADPAAWGQS